MRTEVKIAAVIVIVMVGVATIWYVGWGRKASKAPDKSGQGELAKTEKGGETFVAVEGTSGRREPAEGTSRDDTTEGTSTSEGTGGEGTVQVGMGRSEGSTGTESPSATSGKGKTPTESTARAERPWWEDSDRYPERVTPSGESTSTASSSSGAAESGTAESGTAAAGGTEITPPDRYIVKDGDTYWSIAKELYGDATLYKLLVEANPKIPPKSLRPGMTIKRPPKPARPARSTPARAPKTTHGTTVVDAAGGRYYIVKAGDTGFWGVSQAVFGTGVHWGAIQRLNPKLNSKALQPGQKVKVPKEAPKLARRTRPAPRTGVRPTPRRTTPRAAVGVITGAPARAVLPSGEVFD